MKYDIVIVGAGPAGMTAAIYGRRANKTVLLLEAASYGGQIINAHKIENYPVEPHISGFEFATKLYEQAKELGAEFKFEKVVGIEDKGDHKLVNTPSASYEAGAVIIATGSDKRKLGVDREDELVGRGVSYCATCDGAFFRKKVVAVAGGTRTALEDALYLADIAEKVASKAWRVLFPYDEMNAVMKLFKEMGLPQNGQDFGLDCRLGTRVRLTAEQDFLTQ